MPHITCKVYVPPAHFNICFCQLIAPNSSISPPSLESTSCPLPVLPVYPSHLIYPHSTPLVIFFGYLPLEMFLPHSHTVCNLLPPPSAKLLPLPHMKPAPHDLQPAMYYPVSSINPLPNILLYFLQFSISPLQSLSFQFSIPFVVPHPQFPS